VREFLTSKNNAVVPCPHILQMFPMTSFSSQGLSTTYEYITSLQLTASTVVTNALKDLTVEDLQQCSQGWKDHLQQCVASEEDHAEIAAMTFFIKSASSLL
jgi:hypothetical protein